MMRENPIWRNLRPVGIVFGDIGTSPIYALAITFSFIEKNPQNIAGVLSLIFWALIIIPSVQYSLLAMNLSLRGEGGEIVLWQILVSKIKEKSKFVGIFTLMSIIGISFFIGDAVITPSISILSSYEGLHFVSDISQEKVILLSVLTAFFLFALQRGGAGKVSVLFTPIMILWFVFLFLFGLIYILENPFVLSYISPHYALNFILNNPKEAFLSLSGVILCVTGAEALYADIGHLGKEPIRRSWFFFVLPSLVVSYFGQGAFLIKYGEGNPFFGHIKNLSEFFYIPSVVITTIATVIASQAVISGLFSVFYQGINIGIFPRLKIVHRSGEFRGQIYIGFINWVAFLLVLFMINFFRTSENIGHAYGVAVNIVMVISALFLISIYAIKRSYLFLLLSVLVLVVDSVFLYSNFHKIEEGGYISIIVATVPFLTILIFRMGQRKVYSVLKLISFQNFFEEYKRIYNSSVKISGKAVFLVRDTKNIPPYVMTIIKDIGVVYEENILMTITQTTTPFGIDFSIVNMDNNLRILKIEMGYMEILDITDIFSKLNVIPRTIFYGLEEVITRNPLLKIYSLIKKITPSFESFYNFPTSNIHGIVTKVEV